MQRFLFVDTSLQLAVAPLDQTCEQLVQQLSRGDEYTALIPEFKAEKRKKEWLAVRVLLRHLLQEEKEIAYSPQGKPYFADGSMHLSISHSASFVALALHPTKNIGLDIEEFSPRLQKVRSKFMSPLEEQQLDADQELLHLLLHWSAKEAVFKAMEQEGVDFKQHLYVQPFVPKLNTVDSFELTESKSLSAKTYLLEYYACEDYVLTLALPR